MAEAILTEVATMLFSKLASLVADPILTALGLNNQLKKLQKTMKTINAILADHSKRGNNISCVDKEWILNLEKVIYELDDIFDEILAKAERKKIMEGNAFLKEVKLFFSSSNQLYTCFELSQRVKSIRESLDDIAKDRRDFGSASTNSSIVHGVEESNKHNDVFVPDNVVGRKDDKEHIIEMVLGDFTSSDDEGSVGGIPIVGVGGLGKTTLARQVYSDERVKESFQLHLWVPIPREIKVKEVMERIVSVATGEDHVSNYDIEQLRSRFSTVVNGKKYLLILDDVWDENPLKWRDLRPMLTRGAALGSKIIVTTRSVTVGEIMGTVQSYQLRPLSNDDSRTLFENIVFQNKGRHEPGTRALVGDILGLCRNVPLVIRALAGVLATKFTLKEWLSFKDVELSNLASYGEDFDVVPILRLSYDNLRPSNLKSCFSYLSLFPRGYVIRKRTLIFLWIAQGFVAPIHKGQTLEDVGEMYLNTLIKRSLIQDVEEDDHQDGACKLHDLMYDLACSVNGGQCRMLRSAEDGDFERNMHHVSVGYRLDPSCTTPVALESNIRLRTFLLTEKPSYQVHMSKQVCDKLISSFPCLRALDLHGLGIKELPNLIGKLIHLRYLNLSHNDFKELPDSITLLHNLQYLELYYCCKLLGIPRDMKKLVNLRHLGLSAWESRTGKMRYFPSGLENLTNLERLEVFVVPDPRDERVLESGCWGQKSSYARFRDLSSLNNLRGSLSILIAGSYQNMASDAKNANLKEKKGVKELILCWVRGYEVEDHLTFENLQPHPEISRISIYEYCGDALPTWMETSRLASSLLYLTHLTIHTCPYIKYIPSLSKLPNLTSFLLYALPEVEYLENDIDRYDQLSSSHSSSSSSHSQTIFFPSLTEVYIGHLRRLKGWGESALSFPHATRVTIFHCYVLESMPACPNVEHLKACFVPEHLQMLTVKRHNGASPATTTPKLQTLEVSTVEQLASVPRDYLATVSKLTFGWGQKPLNFSLLAQVLDLMNSLRHLSFFECLSLRSFSGLPMQLGTLERLEFKGCNSTREFTEKVDEDSESCDDYSCSIGSNSWNVFKSLRFLKFDNMEFMNILPEGIQCITTLETLELNNCPRLETIPNWIGCLSSLLRLSIHKCKRLTSLPSEIQSLQKLQQLVVDDCPPLADQCQRDIGKDWHKIQHIPDIIITR